MNTHKAKSRVQCHEFGPPWASNQSPELLWRKCTHVVS